MLSQLLVQPRNLAILVALAPVFGCGRIVGADEYEFAEPGAPAITNSCNQDEVLTDDGECKPVGVQPDMCDIGSGFEPDPSGGCRALLPADECENGLAGPSPSCATPTDSLCNSTNGFPLLGNTSELKVAYVDAGAATEGDGTLATQPFRTLARALESHPDDDPLILYIKGTFNEDVAIARSNVTLQACNDGKTTIVGQEPIRKAPDPGQPSRSASDRCWSIPDYLGVPFFPKAAVCIAPGVHDVTLQGFNITGAGDGVGVFGAQKIVLRDLRIQNTKYFGMRIYEGHPGVESEVSLDNVAIYGAHGAGIFALGSTLMIDDSSIQHTVPLNSWADDELRRNSPEASKVPEHYKVGWARGLAIYPAQWAIDGNRAAPEDFRPSDVEVRHSVITGSQEMAVFVSGAKATFERVFLGALPTAAPASYGRGLVVERSLPSGVGSVVTVLNSVIERTADAAVDVRDATVKLERTTIRDTRGRAGDGCSGQAIRARTFPTDDGVRADIDAVDSTLIGARQAGIFAASSSVKLTRVLVRDVTPEGKEGACAGAMGDGIALETFSGQSPSDGVLHEVRVDNTSRAALLTTGGSLELTSTLLEACERALVDGSGRGAALRVTGAVCGCGGQWSECRRSVEPLGSWISAGPSPVWPDWTARSERCAHDIASQTPLTGFAIFDVMRPEIAPVATGANGCAVSSLGPPDQITGLVLWRPGYLANARGPIAPSPALLAGGLMTPIAQFTRNAGSGTGGVVDAAWLSIQRVPPGSRLIASTNSDTLLLTSLPVGYSLDQGVVPDMALPGSIGNTFLAVLFEPGWRTLTLSDLPAGAHCEQNSAVLGSDTQRNVRFVRAEYGMWTGVEYGDCKPGPP